MHLAWTRNSERASQRASKQASKQAAHIVTVVPPRESSSESGFADPPLNSPQSPEVSSYEFEAQAQKRLEWLINRRESPRTYKLDTKSRIPPLRTLQKACPNTGPFLLSSPPERVTEARIHIYLSMGLFVGSSQVVFLRLT